MNKKNLKNWDVYFEIFGKKIKVKVFADSEESAKQYVKDKIIFHKVHLTPGDELNDISNMADAFIDMLNKKGKP